MRYKVRYVNFTSFVKDHGTIFSKERMFYFAVIFSFFVGSYVYYFSNPETSEGVICRIKDKKTKLIVSHYSYGGPTNYSVLTQE